MLILACLGLGAGVLGGLLGVGGGVLVVPGLVFLLNFDQHRAHGTSLAVIFLMAMAGVATYFAHGNVDLLIAIEMAVGGVIGAAIGAKVANAIHAKSLRRVFSVFMVLIGVRMILHSYAAGPVDTLQIGEVGLIDGALAGTLLVVGTGVLTGFVSSLLGVGGGMVMVPALVILLWVPQKMAQGISLAAMIPTACAGMLMHRSMGNVDLRVAACVGAGAVVGAFAGASTAAILKTAALQVVFGGFLLLAGVLMAMKKQNGETAYGRE